MLTYVLTTTTLLLTYEGKAYTLHTTDERYRAVRDALDSDNHDYVVQLLTGSAPTTPVVCAKLNRQAIVYV